MDLQLKDNLRRILSEKDWSIPTLSKRCGVASTTIQNWAEGKPPRDMRQVKQVANTLGLTLDALCFDDLGSPTENLIEQYREEINVGIFEVILRKKQ
ncbi:Cro/C1-type HTH DNA-binding domain protein [Bacteriovorax sp. BAL6_X]|uniref:helix-turn-helix transcriptional regulator n=1 Tax=Bacteriovorax sp. BAL6_X TaxID=1201290 RepID=UPI000386590F|nr:transcriptional regulator [Bacteriovorax sp. BAL6_X]EPZ52289.1 Cro/C1-type HTH DNA-binding domain protein [Bacteriovorax sp. BAL6_X]